MTIQNLDNCGADPRQLYRIRYGSSFFDADKELYVLAFDYWTALAMFPPYLQTGESSPLDIPDGVQEEDSKQALRSIRGIEKIAEVVLLVK